MGIDSGCRPSLAFVFAAALLVVGSASARTPAPTTGTTPAATAVDTAATTAPATSPCSGPSVTLRGATSTPYSSSVGGGTTFGLYGWYSTGVGGGRGNKGFSASTDGADLCVVGGIVDGDIPSSWDWRQVHTFGGAGYTTAVNAGIAYLDNVRVDDVEDGWHPRERPYPTNKGVMHMKRAYMTSIHDDCIENDHFMSGTIEDSLFDGAFTFLSEQNQNSLTNTMGSDEDPHIYLKNVYVRLSQINAPGSYTVGRWFKWQPYGATNHDLDITDSVFAVDRAPTNKKGNVQWDPNLSFPPGTTFHGTNYILWLGSGPYGGQKPSGVTFLEGQAAKDKWVQVRNDWLASHCYPIPSRAFGYAPSPRDIGYEDDPVVPPGPTCQELTPSAHDP